MSSVSRTGSAGATSTKLRRRRGIALRAAPIALLLLLMACAETRAPPAPGRAAQPAAAERRDHPVAELPGAANPHWTRDLLRLLPAVEQCWSRADGAARVTQIVEAARGRYRIRVRDRAGAGIDCLAEGEAGPVAVVARLDAAAAAGVDERTAFVPSAAAAPPDGVCFEHQRVLDAGGRLIGWLSTNVC